MEEGSGQAGTSRTEESPVRGSTRRHGVRQQIPATTDRGDQVSGWEGGGAPGSAHENFRAPEIRRNCVSGGGRKKERKN